MIYFAGRFVFGFVGVFDCSNTRLLDVLIDRCFDCSIFRYFDFPLNPLPF